MNITEQITLYKNLFNVFITLDGVPADCYECDNGVLVMGDFQNSEEKIQLEPKMLFTSINEFKTTIKNKEGKFKCAEY